MPEPVLRLNDAALEWAAEDGEVVALDLQRLRYLGINESGARLWARLADGATRTDLVRLLEHDYHLGPEQAATDVDAFVSACRSRGYLT